MLEVHDVRYSVGKASILNGISTRFESGRVSMIIGPNGSGKSTLLRIMSLEFPPDSGVVRYGGVIPDRSNRNEIARIRATLSQNIDISFPLTVEEIVMMGRYPHFTLKPSSRDYDICMLAMQRVGVENFRDRNYLTLSGGERQMVQFARVLAQIWERTEGTTRYLFLDEPTSSLDIHYQHRLLGALRSIAADDVVMVVVIHDLNLAAQYADMLVALNHGVKVAEGRVEDVIRTELFMTLYGMHGTIIRNDGLDFPLIVF